MYATDFFPLVFPLAQERVVILDPRLLLIILRENMCEREIAWMLQGNFVDEVSVLSKQPSVFTMFLAGVVDLQNVLL